MKATKDNFTMTTPTQPPYAADAVANEFLRGRLGEIDHLKLQKLVYYAHAWHLALYNEPLIRDRIEAWERGPVVPALYAEFQDCKSEAIDRLANELSEDFQSEEPIFIHDSDKRSKDLIERIWQVYGNLTGIQLSNLSHSDNEPWSKIPKRRPGLQIPDELIKNCFKEMWV